jgi:ferritin
MDEALTRLGLETIDTLTADSLKQAFRKSVVNAHPDKGGSDTDFDEILSAYVYLSGMIRRMTGGRNGFQVLHASDVKQARDEQFTNELNNLVNDVFEHLDSSSNEAFRDKFNKMFEKNHVRDDASERGYDTWFRSEQEEEAPSVHVTDPSEWNRAFESTVKQGKPEPTALILHPDEMAFRSSMTRGAALITSTTHSFTSNPDDCPEYTDLHDAYTSENTMFDKVPLYQDKPRTFEDILKERDIVYQAELDRNLEEIATYEKRKQEEEKQHKEKIAVYFSSTSSSQWALREKNKSFVKEFK